MAISIKFRNEKTNNTSYIRIQRIYDYIYLLYLEVISQGLRNSPPSIIPKKDSLLYTDKMNKLREKTIDLQDRRLWVDGPVNGFIYKNVLNNAHSTHLPPMPQRGIWCTCNKLAAPIDYIIEGKLWGEGCKVDITCRKCFTELKIRIYTVQ